MKWNYLPRDDNVHAYCEVSTREVVTINESLKACPHPATTHFDFTDLRDEYMQRYMGDCCVRCGKILTIENGGVAGCFVPAQTK